MYQIKGIVAKLSTVDFIGEKKYPKQMVWIRTEGKYPQTIELEAFGDRANDTSILTIGDSVNFTFDVKGREWTGKDGVQKVFTSLSIIKVEVEGKTSYKEQAQGAKETQKAFQAEVNDSLPF